MHIFTAVEQTLLSFCPKGDVKFQVEPSKNPQRGSTNPSSPKATSKIESQTLGVADISVVVSLK
jgi:hypothetical protein